MYQILGFPLAALHAGTVCVKAWDWEMLAIGSGTQISCMLPLAGQTKKNPTRTPRGGTCPI